MKSYKAFIFLIVTAIFVVGCKNTEPPRIFHPKPLSYQRAEAQLFDPFPNETGGPEIVGARPDGFQEPRAEARQIQPPKRMVGSSWLPWNWFRN